MHSPREGIVQNGSGSPGSPAEGSQDPFDITTAKFKVNQGMKLWFHLDVFQIICCLLLISCLYLQLGRLCIVLFFNSDRCTCEHSKFVRGFTNIRISLSSWCWLSDILWFILQRDLPSVENTTMQDLCIRVKFIVFKWSRKYRISGDEDFIHHCTYRLLLLPLYSWKFDTHISFYEKITFTFHKKRKTMLRSEFVNSWVSRKRAFTFFPVSYHWGG